MTTITREQLHERARRKVKELEFAITQSAFTSIRDGLEEELELARIALASLEVAPVGEVSEKRHGLVMDGTVDLGGKSTYRIIKGEKAMKRLPLGTKFYIAPPAPVVDADPVVFTDERNLHHIAMGRETSLIWGKQNQEVGDIPLYRHAQPVPVVPEEIEPDSNNTYDYVDGWNAFRAALLQGAEPVSQTYKSQHTQFEQVADLYEMQFDDGRTCAFHTDAQKAAQWLQACDGNRVQEYVKLERLRNALSGNYPVTPDGWISCSEQMPVIGELNWRTSFPLLVTCEIGVIPAYYGFVSVNGDRHYGFMESLKYGDDNGNHPQTNEYGLISNVTHWMPLPEPPMEEK